MITNQALTNQSKSGNGQEPTNIQRRTLIGGALAALLSSSGRLMASSKAVPNDPFILLLRGVYQPVVDGPDLGLSSVNLSDGTYSKTRIYPIFGIPGSQDPDDPIGTFFVQLAGNLCAYQLPGGAIAMSFNNPPAGAPPGFNGFVSFPGRDGWVLLGRNLRTSDPGGERDL
jgi:hypothetical protein